MSVDSTTTICPDINHSVECYNYDRFNLDPPSFIHRANYRLVIFDLLNFELDFRYVLLRYVVTQRKSGFEFQIVRNLCKVDHLHKRWISSNQNLLKEVHSHIQFLIFRGTVFSLKLY